MKEKIKGIVLAGGTGSRLYPLTKVTNKHLLPVGTKPMIYYPIEKLVEADINEILVVTGIEHMGDVVSLLGSGKEFGCKFTYKVQDEPGGIAQALGLAENFIGNSKMVIILGDNIFYDSINSFVSSFIIQDKSAKIILKEVPDPNRYGVAEINNNSIISIEEKPLIPKSNYCVTGVYFYNNSVFDIIRELKPSKRNELEITDVNNYYLKNDNLTFDIMNGWWTDAGTFESLSKANELVLQDKSL